MNRMIKAALLALMLLMLPALSLAAAPVLLLELPENAQMVENVGFDNGDFIQTYQLEDGVSVQLLRYTGFAMTMDDLILGDWPVNCGVEMQAMTEISGAPAQHAHILQVFDQDGYPVKGSADKLKKGEQLMEIDLILVSVEGTTLIYQSMAPSGEHAQHIAPIIESLQVTGDSGADVG